MSGTIITSGNPNGLIEWLKYIVEFEVTPSNYLVACCNLISRRAETKIVVENVDIEAPLLQPEYYRSLVPFVLGGTATTLQFTAAVEESYRAVTAEVIRQAKTLLSSGEKLFICARNTTNVDEITNGLAGYNIHHITAHTPITLTPATPNNIHVVITTIRHVEGYTLTDRRVAIQPLVFSNQASRDQRDARLNRIGQLSDRIWLINIHAGILSYINTKYKHAKSLAEAAKCFATKVDVTNLY